MLGQVVTEIVYQVIVSLIFLLIKTSYRVDVTVEDRYNCDLVTDTRGQEWLELCISNQLRIINGRSFGDSVGIFTCFNYTGSSVVNYFIVSERLLEDVLYMSVSDFITLLSDCHCKISLTVVVALFILNSLNSILLSRNDFYSSFWIAGWLKVVWKFTTEEEG